MLFVFLFSGKKKYFGCTYLRKFNYFSFTEDKADTFKQLRDFSRVINLAF